MRGDVETIFFAKKWFCGHPIDITVSSLNEGNCYIIVHEKNNEIVKRTMVLKILTMLEAQAIPGISKALRPLCRTTTV